VTAEEEAVLDPAPPAPPRRSPLAHLRRATIDTAPLRYPDYRRLWMGNAVSLIGFQLTAVAVPVEVYAITRDSFWVGMLGLAGLVPLIVFGLWGGAIADAVDRRKLLLISSVLVWLCTVALFFQAVLGLDSIPLLFVLVALQSAGFAVASPTRGAIIPRLIPPDLVPAANTLNFTANNVGLVAGPLLAGVVISHWSFAAAYAVDALLFSVALYSTLRLPPLPPLGEISRPGLRSVIDGLAFIATRPVLLLSFAVDIVAMVFAMPRALFPEAADERFGGGPAVGWLFAAIAIGAVMGGLFSGWIGRVRRQGVALVAAIVAWGLAVAGAGLVGGLWAAVALLAVAGAADLVSAVYRQTILQVYAPDEMRGRMQGVFIVVVAGGPRLGDLRAGATASVTGSVTASWVGGGVVCAILVVVVALCFRSLIRYDAEAPHPVAPSP
jgi:MFS family permease